MSRQGLSNKRVISIVIVLVFAALYYHWHRGGSGPDTPAQAPPAYMGYETETRKYINSDYGFTLDIPRSWKEFAPVEAAHAGVLERGLEDGYFLITGPDGLAGPLLFGTKSLIDSEYFRSRGWDAYVTEVSTSHQGLFDMVSLSSGFQVFEVGYMVGSDYREESFFYSPGGELVELYFTVRSPALHKRALRQMKAVLKSLKKQMD